VKNNYKNCYSKDNLRKYLETNPDKNKQQAKDEGYRIFRVYINNKPLIY
jgi:hypothetical protein